MRHILLSLSLVMTTALVVSGCGSSSDSGTSDTGGSVPGAVTRLVVTPGDGANTLTWEAVEGAISYEVYWTSDAGTTFRDAECDGNLIEGITGTSYTHTGLTNGIGYRYAVTAITGDGTESACPSLTESFVPTPSGGGSTVYGCNQPGAINYDPTVTVYQPGSCHWSTSPTPTPVEGACGSASGKTYPDSATGYGADTFCSVGTANPASPAFPALNATASWNCLGTNGGSAAACSANRGADLTPPTTTVALAEASKTSFTWTGSATINENGTGYCTALTNGAAPPTASEVKADNNPNKAGTGGSVAMTANATANCTVSGLQLGATYDFYFVAEDGIPNLQANGAVSGPVTATIPISATVRTQLIHGISTDQAEWLVATTDTDSTGYCVAVPQGSPAPSVSQVAAGTGGAIVGVQGTGALTANAKGFCAVTGLTASTAYDLYFVAKDGGNAFQPTVGGVLNQTTTAAQGAPPAGMVAVLGGCYMMGDSFAEGNANELPVHPVCLSSFFMDATEVTQAAHTAWHDPGVLNRDTTFVGYFFPDGAACGGSAATCPAEQVDWDNASAFCAFYGKRLPTEAEWEYAARERGRVVRYATGSDAITCNDANYLGCVGATQDVAKAGASVPNALGLYDMSGNVYEWIADWYNVGYYTGSPLLNPTGPAFGSTRVVRGGSYNSPSGSVRAAYRLSLNPTLRFKLYGFRCVSQ